MVHCLICGEETDNLQVHIQQNHHDLTHEQVMQAFQQMMPKPQERLAKNNNWQSFYAFDTHIDLTWFDIRISAINEVSQESNRMNPAEPIITRWIDATYILNPVAAKALHSALGNAIAEFEAQVGEIKSPIRQN